MKYGDVFPSSYLKVADIPGTGIVYTMKGVSVEVFKDQEDQTEESKPVLYFTEEKRGLPVNKTNWKRIAALYGDESDEWAGKQVTLTLEKVDSFGKTQDAIRIVEAVPKKAKGKK